MKNYKKFLENLVEVKDDVKNQESSPKKDKMTLTKLFSVLKPEKAKKTKSEILSKEKEKLIEIITKKDKSLEYKKAIDDYRILFGKESANNLSKKLKLNIFFR
jgi:hypothetical protein